MARWFRGRGADRWAEGERLDLPPPASARFEHPAGYLCDEGLRDAVNVALQLGQPLLLTGDPGTGRAETPGVPRPVGGSRK